VKIERGVTKRCSLSLILFNLYSEYLSKKALEGFRGFKIGQVSCTVKYKDDLVLLIEEEMVLQGMIDRVIEVGRCYGNKLHNIRSVGKPRTRGCPPGKCITGPRNTRMEETSWGERRMEVTFEGGQGPEGAVVPYMDG
jgi:hypothetical protein